MLKIFFREAAARVTVVVVLFGSLAFMLPETKGQIPPKRALVISLDGLDTRYLHDADKYNLRIPTLRRLMASGITACGMTSVYRSIT